MGWEQAFTDPFDGAEFTALDAYDPTWVNHCSGVGSTMRIGTGGATVGGTGNARASVTTVLTDKQAVEIEITSVTAGSGGNGILICFANDGTGFWDWRGLWMFIESTGVTFYRGDNDGAGDVIATRTSTISNSDVMRVEFDGVDTFTIYQNGSPLGADIVESSYVGGRGGLKIDTSADAWAGYFTALSWAEEGGGAVPFRTRIGAVRR